MYPPDPKSCIPSSSPTQINLRALEGSRSSWRWRGAVNQVEIPALWGGNKRIFCVDGVEFWHGIVLSWSESIMMRRMILKVVVVVVCLISESVCVTLHICVELRSLQCLRPFLSIPLPVLLYICKQISPATWSEVYTSTTFNILQTQQPLDREQERTQSNYTDTRSRGTLHLTIHYRNKRHRPIRITTPTGHHDPRRHRR